ncbi:unnamed protein product [Phytomonas sp. EM1]|nr:unnamed protein product [Phytomonas sp. EM1]|eukprot:CCW61458.1 unnamed protein product [Phytomonas sp. isolate EM1]
MNIPNTGSLDRRCSHVATSETSAILPHTLTPDMVSTDGLQKDHPFDITTQKDSFCDVDEVRVIEEQSLPPSESSKRPVIIPQPSLSEKLRGHTVAFQSDEASDTTQSSNSEDDEGWVKTTVREGSTVDVKRGRMTNTMKYQSCQIAGLKETMPHHPIISFSGCTAISPDVADTTFPESIYPHTPTAICDLSPIAPGTTSASVEHSIVPERQPVTSSRARGHFMQSRAFSRSTLAPRPSPLDYNDNNTATVGSKSLNYSHIPNYILGSGGLHDNNTNTSIFMDLLPSTFSSTQGAWSTDPTSSNRAESSFLNSVVKQKGRSALIAELMHRRECLKKKLTQLQLTATAKNIFAIVRASKVSQLQYLLQERLLKVNERDYNGCTPLHVAASEGNMAIVKLLLSFGADVLALDSFGRTPLDCAAAHRQSGVARYLMAVIRAPWQQEEAAAADVQSIDKGGNGDCADPPEVPPSLFSPSPPGSSLVSSLEQSHGCKINVDASFLSIPDFAPIQAPDKINDDNYASSSVSPKVTQRGVTPSREAETTLKERGSGDAIMSANFLEGLPPVEIGVGLSTTLHRVRSSDASSSQLVQLPRSHMEENTDTETGGLGRIKTVFSGSQLVETQRDDAVVGRLELPQTKARSEEKSDGTIGVDAKSCCGEFKATIPLAVTTQTAVPEQPQECFVGCDLTAGQTPKKSSVNTEVEQAPSHDKTADVAITLREHSKFTTVPDSVSLIVCLCGLPGRGKSFISLRLMRYMNWKGIPCRVFNAGSYRRKLLGVEGTSKADFYDPNNLQGRKQREIMAVLACEDLVSFIMHHRVAIGILDATNTTRSRRSKLKNFFAMECGRRSLQYRLLFIESVCTDEGVITENILRSKLKNDDFKGINDTNAVIAEFRNRIQQYEKVYETLHPSEGLSFIKIINAKHHIILYRVSSGLGSRVGFFLMNLHPISHPIYIVLPGETEGDREGVYGGSERLTARGESFSWALKHFIQDRYVPHMLILHGTNQSVLSTLRPLLQGEDETAGKSNLNYLYQPLVHHAFDTERAHHRNHRDEDGVTGLVRNTGIVYCRHAVTLGHSPHCIISPNISDVPHVASPRQQIVRAPLSTRPPEDVDATKAMKGGCVSMIPFPDTQHQQPREHQDRLKSCSPHTECLDNNDEDDEAIEEVLCGVPGLDNINYGLFSGHNATWAAHHYPRLLPLIHATGLADWQPDTGLVAGEATAQEETKGNTCITTPTIAGAGPGRGSCAPRPIRFSSFTDAIRCLHRPPADVDPSLAYNMHFPNGESFRQVSVRLESALMAVMRTQSPVFVVASSIAAQGVLAFFTDVMPERLMTLRLPQHSVVEISFNESITVHPLLPDVQLNCKPSVVSPILTQEEIDKTLQLAYSTH